MPSGYLSRISGSSGGSGQEGSGWSRWQVAVAVGIPVGLGAAAWWWWWRYHRPPQKPPASGASTPSSASSAKKSASRMRIPDPGAAGECLSPLDRAEAAKTRGNAWFKESDYKQAITCYTEAIKLCPKDKKSNLSTFYQNRAAAFEQLKDYAEVIKDTSEALSLNPTYCKALNRRAKAFEKTEEYQKTLEDVTAACILEQFQNQQTLLMADRVLKVLGQQKAREAMKAKKPVIPSSHYIKMYFTSFMEDPVLKFDMNGDAPNAQEEPLKGFLKAQHNLLDHQYEEIIADCTEEIESSGRYKVEALLLRATFYMLQAQSEPSFKDFETLIATEGISTKVRVNGLIKLATLKVHHDQLEGAMSDFETASGLDSENADIYHHRGGIHLLNERCEEASADYAKALALRPDFAMAAVQKCYADYRQAYMMRNREALTAAMQAFKDTVDRFPTCVEGYTLYAQALSDQGEYDLSDDFYKRALKVEPNNASVFVHRGLLTLQSKQDFQEAVKLMKMAIEKDNKCAYAYETLGTIEVQRGNLDAAVKLFNEAINLLRTEAELTHLYSLREAALTQKVVAERLGMPVPIVDNM